MKFRNTCYAVVDINKWVDRIQNHDTEIILRKKTLPEALSVITHFCISVHSFPTGFDFNSLSATRSFFFPFHSLSLSLFAPSAKNTN